MDVLAQIALYFFGPPLALLAFVVLRCSLLGHRWRPVGSGRQETCARCGESQLRG